ncbi:NAD(P)/FAD-dependent oxidoreductase [Shinella daejeonensis]|uniref:NAD(P)/FAD-dependent oxidoreductase n=1 Tax=Shinella daejeonensis TaxID=659017 RepID=UPI0020C74EBF|nr:NAD(P)/FAD-dependent oxidoreductase [Shinella daejeonensis]MCP8893598.1 NAD(P)/FAD-dependent oxidoreductase [Shinella daejeonensis]
MAGLADADVVLIGAGPVALFSVFQLGLYGLTCHLVDSLDRAGGQCIALYPDKPIHDVPGFPAIDGEELTARLMTQIAPFSPTFSFGRTVSGFAAEEDGRLRVLLDGAESLSARTVVLATGLGAFHREDGEACLRPGPSRDWPLARTGDAFRVGAETFETTTAGVFAIGDACHYPGKLRLILSGFHEAALMTQAVRRRLAGGGRTTLEYTTSTRVAKKLRGAAAGEE